VPAAALVIRQRLAANEPERADFQRDLSVSHERMGDMFRALGQTDDAREAFAAALAIRERLAANERVRADYQMDVVGSLARTALHAGCGARALLERAASILRTLDADGRLAPADRPKIDAIAELLASLP
jgi:hypothetical protein